MKLTIFSDTHGVCLPKIEECDVVCICGDIIPLDIQNKMVESVAWFAGKFVPWCMSLPCEKVILIGGNHDFMYQAILRHKNQHFSLPENILEAESSSIITHTLNIPEKIVYLQDSAYRYNGVLFYGTPWCPDLRNWAFYKNTVDLDRAFKNIPEKVDVLLTHTPGKGVNETETSIYSDGYRRSFGCKELTDAVAYRDIKYWFCGHVHTGNHKLTEWPSPTGDMAVKVANVSILDEAYDEAYDPLVIEM